MPMGSYANFNECLAAQKKKGRGDKSAHKICGAIYQATEGRRKKRAKKELRDMDNSLAEIEQLRKELGAIGG